jgi:hypothetical protein
MTPEERQFRRRLRVVLVSLIVLGLIPYPTQVCPPVTVQLVDDKGKPVMDVVSMHWNGFTNAGSLEGYVQFDSAARATVSRQWLWVNPVSRFLSLIPFPHGGGGWATTTTTLNFPMPADYELDAAAMGQKLTGSSFSDGAPTDWIDPKTGNARCADGKTHWIGVDPGWLGSSPLTIKIVLRRKGPATRPSGAGG